MVPFTDLYFLQCSVVTLVPVGGIIGHIRGNGHSTPQELSVDEGSLSLSFSGQIWCGFI